jgi:hypothetical protein
MSLRPVVFALAVALLGVVDAGCSKSESEPAQDPVSAHDHMPVGSRAAFTLFAHCGVEFTEIDGDTWRTKRRDDGDGNPPAGWPGAIEGTLTRPSENRAVFVSDAIPVVLVFRPAPNTMYICA